MAKPHVYPAPLSVDVIYPGDTYAFNKPEPTVLDVKRSFRTLKLDGNYLAAWDGAQMQRYRYTSSIVNVAGLNNHFQGIQRLRRGAYFVLSGGDPHERPMSHLFVVHLPSLTAPDAWGSNLLDSRKPPPDDRVVGRVDINSDLWHAGGLSLCGNIVAVPIENAKESRSKVVFYDFKEPLAPRRFAHEIERPNHNGGAVALTQLENGRFVCAVWSNSESHVPRQRLDLYLSKGNDFTDGFVQQPATIVWCVRRWAKFQTISFVRQTGDRALYVLGFETETFLGVTAPIPFLLKNLSPLFKGRNYGRLIRVECDEMTCNDIDALASMRFEYVTERRFFCKRKQCNMDAATGPYVTDDSHLLLYSAYHWRTAMPKWDFVRASEFVPELPQRVGTSPTLEGQS